MESDTSSVRVEFPNFSCSILQKLNQQRQRGQLCDIVVSIGGHQYRAHRAVLAASSPYFCDQVLLKNSARVALPEVMNHWVFEGLLQSCYTGALTLPACEVVAFLTAASFLQMWHVVDKCTELLEASGGAPSRSFKTPLTALACRSGTEEEQLHASPGGGSPYGDRGAEGGAEGSAGSDGCRGLSDFEQLLEEGFSPQALDMAAAAGSSEGSPPPPDRAEAASENGDSEAPKIPRSRPLYVPPSIMGHRKWMQVKTERPGREDCRGAMGLDSASTDSEHLGLSHHRQGMSSMHSADNSTDDKLANDLDESLDCDPSFDDPLDFYGTSTERGGCSPGASKNNRHGEDEEDEETDGMDAAGPDETAGSGVGPGVYKLYPCQCGKSFTHKSQRDRHMSMHLGLRPYGCAVCGKSFKMKHHLVGHMKIHTGIKPYECSFCAKRFMWRDSFNRHTSSCKRARQAKQTAAAEQSVA